jgi:hypothetical protein
MVIGAKPVILQFNLGLIVAIATAFILAITATAFILAILATAFILVIAVEVDDGTAN